MTNVKRVLILGSGTDAPEASSWPRDCFDSIVVINNAWNIRDDWSHLIYPEDFPEERRPHQYDRESQSIVTAQEFVPVQNEFGGFIYAGGTMAFTAGYWALGALKPDILAFFGCDMIYRQGKTHFYGVGKADPLRDDITLQSLEAKASRLMLIAAQRSCLTVNLSRQPQSRLVFPRHQLSEITQWTSADLDRHRVELENTINIRVLEEAIDREIDLGYFAKSGRYWENLGAYDPDELRRLDDLWLKAGPAAHTN